MSFIRGLRGKREKVLLLDSNKLDPTDQHEERERPERAVVCTFWVVPGHRLVSAASMKTRIRNKSLAALEESICFSIEQAANGELASTIKDCCMSGDLACICRFLN